MIPPAIVKADLFPLVPAAVLAGGATLLALSEVFLAQSQRTYQAILAVLTALLAGALAAANADGPGRAILQGFGVHDGFASFTTVLVCGAAALASLLAAGFLKHRNAERGEFYALVLFSAAGMVLLAMSGEFITLFVNLELMSISTYALAAYLRRGPRPSEAAFKYFILGAFASALLLYGTSLLYGATGSTKLAEMAAALPRATASQPLLVYVGFALVLAGFAFKVGAVPFHMWTPDVYEGAPTPVTALMSVGVKAAAFVALVRVLSFFAKEAPPHILYALVAALALVTMIGGNLLALPQRNVKRMLAYSSIAHAGYLLLGVAALVAPKSSWPGTLSPTLLIHDGAGVVPGKVQSSILFYLLAYTVTALGAFGVVGAIERRDDETRGSTWDLERFAGLAQRQPGWAVAMAVCLLSLAGVPPTVGFLGKLLVFSAAVDAGLVWLAVVGVLASVAGVFYYLRVIVAMFMRPAPADGTLPPRHWTSEVAIAAAALLVVLLGLVPEPVLSWVTRAGLLFAG